MHPLIGQRALGRALLARQHLTARTSQLTTQQAVTHLAGLQAQSPTAPYYALAARLEHFTPDDLSTLITGRTAVRLALMRSTLHLVDSHDALAWRPLLQPALERALKATHGKRLTGIDPDALAAATRELTATTPRTFAELGPLLAERFPGHQPDALAQAARTHVPLVQTPPRGLWGHSGQAAHQDMHTWLAPTAPEATTPQATAADLVTRYLTAYGPASIKDAQTWSGLTRLRTTFEELRPHLTVFRTTDGTELFDLPDAPRPDPETPTPARLLGDFDNTLLSYADRSRILGENERARLFTANGIIRPTVLLDGVAAGTWRLDRTRTTATLTVTTFRTLRSGEDTQLHDEATRLLAFAAPDTPGDTRITTETNQP